MTNPAHPSRWMPWLGLALLAVAVFAWRAPTFGFRVWNVDEAIHAAVARTLLDGGVLYRDTVDQRTPLSYYAVAGLFRVTGENNVVAMHALAAALIVLTAAGLFLLGCAWRGTGAGIWAALLFAALSSALFEQGDTYALHTEWFVACFATWAAWAFARGWLATAGALLGLAFLSKQPALLEVAAPLAALAWGADRSRLGRQVGVVLAGFLAPVLLTLAYFAARGALGDFYFYAWEYNPRFYGPEIDTAARVASALKPFQLLGAHYALVLTALAGGTAWCLVRVLQLQPDAAEQTENPRLAYLLAWGAAALAGGAAGGRGYDHYFIPFLPACCLAGALGITGLLQWAGAHRARSWLRPLALGFAALVVVQVVVGLVQFRRQPPQPVDPSLRAAEFIRDHTAATDRIFVWGYHPDIYLFSDRRPASRFVYAS